MNAQKHEALVSLVSDILTIGHGSIKVLPRGDLLVEMFVDDVAIVKQAVDRAAQAKLLTVIKKR